MSNYRLTREAAEKLEEIWLYTAEKWGPEQADTYLDKLDSGLNKIADGGAAACSCKRFSPNVPDNVFYYLVESHFVIYQNANSEVIDILTVIHAVSSEQLSEFLSRLD